MAKGLEAETLIVDALGAMLRGGTRGWWKLDEAFRDLARDNELSNAMVSEITGEMAAPAHVDRPQRLKRNHRRKPER